MMTYHDDYDHGCECRRCTGGCPCCDETIAARFGADHCLEADRRDRADALAAPADFRLTTSPADFDESLPF